MEFARNIFFLQIFLSCLTMAVNQGEIIFSTPNKYFREVESRIPKLSK